VQQFDPAAFDKAAVNSALAAVPSSCQARD
jgi:hypothetical protein